MVITDIYKPKKAFIVDSNVTHSAKSWPKYQTNQARVQGGNNNIRVSNPSYNKLMALEVCPCLKTANISCLY